MLRVDHLSAGYRKTQVLTEMTFDVADAEIVAILGRNGVGKSTLLRALVGQIPLMGGRICLGERDISRAPAHYRARLGVSYVPQGRQIFPGLTVLDNLRVAAFATRQRDWRASLDEVYELFPVLRAKRGDPGGSLSGGQQQILALARALMTRPKVLLLDEPSEGIQPSIVAEIGETVRRLNQERGITVLLVEQNLDFATRVARHAYVVDKGCIVRDLPAKDILADRELQHEYMGV